MEIRLCHDRAWRADLGLCLVAKRHLDCVGLSGGGDVDHAVAGHLHVALGEAAVWAQLIRLLLTSLSRKRAPHL